MKLDKLFLGLLLWLIPFALSGQRYISGCVSDAETGETIPGASVFIANTTEGTTTDIDGNYRLEIQGVGNYQLVISHVGYKPVFRNIEHGKDSYETDVALETRQLDEVVVVANVKFRSRDIDLFWRTILGKSPSKKTIYATNPEAAYFYYNSETRILKVTCHTPLQIVNNETGYQIKYVLNYFTHDYNYDISSWEGQCMYSEFEPENYRQKNIWEENREKVYRVSITKFVKSLYNSALSTDGFLLTYLGNSPSMNEPIRKLSLPNANNLLSIDSINHCKIFHLPTDSIVALICFGKQVTGTDLGNVRFAQNGKTKWATLGFYRNLISIPGEPVRIYPDGTFENTLDLTPTFHSNSLTGLDMALPLEYNPDFAHGTTNVNVITGTAHSEDTLSGANFRFASALDNVAKRFGKQLSIFPQEKTYLHTDKPYYISGYCSHLIAE